MVARTRVQARKSYKEPDTDDEFEIAPALYKSCYTKKSRAGNVSKVKKHSDHRHRRRGSSSVVLPSRPEATFSGLPTELYSAICEKSTRTVYKPIPGITFTSWGTCEFESGITGVNRRMRETAHRTMLALDRSETATVWIHFDQVMQLPRLIFLISQAYKLGERWLAAHPSTPMDDPDWQRVKQISSFSINVPIHEYLSPPLYADTYRTLGHFRYTNLDGTRRTHFMHFASTSDNALPHVLSNYEMRDLRTFLDKTIERLRYPDHTRGELEIRIVLRDFTNPDWGMNTRDSADTNRKQLLRLLDQLKTNFREDMRLKFSVIGLENGDGQLNFEETVQEYQNLLSGPWWNDVPLDVEFFGILRAEYNEVFRLEYIIGNR